MSSCRHIEAAKRRLSTLGDSPPRSVVGTGSGSRVRFTGAVTESSSGAAPEPARSGARGTVAALLAAGEGRRFGGVGHKLLAELPATDDRPAETVIARSLASVIAARAASDPAPLDAVIIVTGAADLGDVVRHVDDVQLVHNERWAQGQATSVQRAIRAADELGADIVVIGLADQPDVAGDTWRAVAAAALEPDAAPVTVATYDGKPRNPVALHRSVWPLLPTEGDSGARDLVRLRPDLVRPVPSSGSPADIDTVEDLSRWLNS